ncbi:hypothetical protein FA09DRAFT_347049 [Tilletiopsis washingtonensis]|uniref:Uncharacterized protein n=1 Tax=Tilletiopsis washingtonensis TaxID=58919 RepID=A0A316Z1L2_9BASI|nr:hypothetical protein FA09DRAFT_347049 [Tilletiopsis washingtonensis]PWN95667.1 hypothetical protein FA09DRAFT_347049 [Tilletiopsis washingtonensis]
MQQQQTEDAEDAHESSVTVVMRSAGRGSEADVRVRDSVTGVKRPGAKRRGGRRAAEQRRGQSARGGRKRRRPARRGGAVGDVSSAPPAERASAPPSASRALRLNSDCAVSQPTLLQRSNAFAVLFLKDTLLLLRDRRSCSMDSVARGVRS